MQVMSKVLAAWTGFRESSASLEMIQREPADPMAAHKAATLFISGQVTYCIWTGQRADSNGLDRRS
jgi:hypothetical protein